MARPQGAHADLVPIFWAAMKLLVRRAHIPRDAAIGERGFDCWSEYGDEGGAAMEKVGPVTFISTWREVPVHTDPSFPEWSHLLVLRSKHSRVWSAVEDLPEEQPPGTILPLNVHRPHWLTRQGYEHPCLWTAVVLDAAERYSEIDARLRFIRLALDLQDWAKRAPIRRQVAA
jgi:hypothetical protein